MSRQGETGKISEELVLKKINDLGLVAYKPIPDKGADLIIKSPNSTNTEVIVQVKGRGEVQKNYRYRWFQIRTTKRQREVAIANGLPLSECWRNKVDKVDIFIFVSIKYKEFWIFDSKDIEKLIYANSLIHGNRKDNITGQQVEIDLDIYYSGAPLTRLFNKNLNNWGLILKKFL